jgi:ABC-type branched-subunit amino acid transport system substrate-binding protein
VTVRVLAATVVALTLAGVAWATGADTPGVSKDRILIGGTVPLSGPETAYSVVAYGADAYFKYVNDHGGVYGRKIEYRYLDDAYDPSQTVQQVRRLVEQDNVFAIFNQVGTEQVLASRPYLNQRQVPQLFAGSGAQTFAHDYKQYPWTLPYLPSFQSEGAVYGRYIARTAPHARIAVLYEDSDFGKDLLAGLRSGLGAKAKVVKTASYAVTEAALGSQLATLKASRADTLMVFALPKQTIQALVGADKLGWHPQPYIAAVSIDPFVMNVARFNTGGRATAGAISLTFLKDASNLRRWGKDPGVKLYYSILERYAPSSDPKAVANIYGMAAAYTLVDALKRAGRNPNRESLLKAATTLRERTNPFLLPGIVAKTAPTDRFALEQVQLYRYTHGVWRAFGPIVPARA